MFSVKSAHYNIQLMIVRNNNLVFVQEFLFLFKIILVVVVVGGGGGVFPCLRL